MKNKAPFDFLIDKDINILTVKKEFAAAQQLVWDAYTKSELLDQWFAPKPLSTKTKIMNFSEGGQWIYAMVEPEGKEYWGRMDYEKINPINYYMGWDGFSDENGTLDTDLPRAKWEVSFKAHGENTIVESIITYSSLADLETVTNMGMEEGMRSTMERLDDLLVELKK